MLARNVDPPTRQQMILAGIKAVEKAGSDSLPSGIARRVSDLSNANQLASLLAETWANSKLVDRETRDESFLQGVALGRPRQGQAAVGEGAEGRRVVRGQPLRRDPGCPLGMDEKARKPLFHQILEGGPADQAGAMEGRPDRGD